MATNKRKDSAALFELIDKSTLKVPKHTGSLKIPSWWSSKSNPPAAPPVNGAGVPEPLAGRSVPATDTHAETQASAPVGPSVIPQPRPQPRPQSRLFEPPAANIQGASPSIRPPLPSTKPRTAAMPTTRSNGNGLHSSAGNPVAQVEADAASGALMDSQAGPEPVPPSGPQDHPAAAVNGPRERYAGSGSGRRVFAPQTMSQTEALGGDWAGAQKFRLARAPMWVLVAGASGVLVVLAIIVYLLLGVHWASQKPLAATGRVPLVGPPSRQASLPPTPGPRQILPAGNGGNLQEPRPPRPADPPPPRTTPGQVFAPGAVARSLDLYYIVIATSPSAEISRRNADLLAANGVDVSLETQMGRSNHLLYKLISVKGFSTISEAQPLKKQIVDIGHLLPDFARTRKAWDDATAMRWSSLVGNARN